MEARQLDLELMNYKRSSCQSAPFCARYIKRIYVFDEI